jgi:hypothetical protein
MGIAKIVELITTALTSWQVMVYRAMQFWMLGKRKAANPTLWIDRLEYLLFGCNRHWQLHL